MSIYIIYKTTNLINGKIYIGQHNTSADDGYLGSGLKLKRSLDKYGKENFKRETLEYCTSANINEREIYWISELSAINENIGYNISSGGTGGCVWIGDPPAKGKVGFWFGKKMTNESKLKMSKYRKGKSYEEYMGIDKAELKRKNHSEKMKGKSSGMKGHKHSEETKLKYSIDRKGRESPNKGKKMPEETKQKISDSLKGKKHNISNIEEFKIKMSELKKGKNIGDKNGMFGKKHLDETKKKMSEKKKEYFKTKKSINYGKSKFIYFLISPDGIKYENIENIREFANNHNLNINGLLYSIFKSKNKIYNNWKVAYVEKKEIDYEIE